MAGRRHGAWGSTVHTTPRRHSTWLRWVRRWPAPPTGMACRLPTMSWNAYPPLRRRLPRWYAPCVVRAS
eukprot:7784231-Pyramimonas_sp.AAC.1